MLAWFEIFCLSCPSLSNWWACYEIEDYCDATLGFRWSWLAYSLWCLCIVLLPLPYSLPCYLCIATNGVVYQKVTLKYHFHCLRSSFFGICAVTYDSKYHCLLSFQVSIAYATSAISLVLFPVENNVNEDTRFNCLKRGIYPSKFKFSMLEF